MRKIYISFLILFAFILTQNIKSSAQACFENFDGVTAPALPTGWTATFGTSCAASTRWVTQTTTTFNSPNAVFTNDPNCVSDEYLDSRSYPIVSATAQLRFHRNNTLESGFDGMVLEIKIGAGAFQDIITAGGSFVAGGYNGTISAAFQNPIGGRQAWTGTSGGWTLTTVNLPASANGQNIVLRWRRATDNSVASTGAFIDNVILIGADCPGNCTGTPTPGTISGPATACAGNNVTLSLSGQSPEPGITLQWASSTTSGGPYSDIPGATGTSYTFSAQGGTRYYVVRVSCIGGGTATTAQHTLTVGAPVLSGVVSTITTACTPGAATINATASGGVLPGATTYTYSITGPGTITQTTSGTGNDNVLFNITNLAAGTQNYTITVTDGLGCTATATTSFIIKQTPIITIVPASPLSICHNQIQQLTASVNPATVTSFNQPAITQVPASPTTTGIASPYPTTLTVSGLPTSGVTVKSVKLGNFNHTFPDDVDVVLVSPTGQVVVLMSDVGGGTDAVGLDFTLDDAAAAAMSDGGFNAQGTYRPTNSGATDNFPAPGPGSVTQATPTLSTFTGNMNGTWNLYIMDDASGDLGYLGNWSINFNVPSMVSWSPNTNLFTDAAATVPYVAGTPVNSVYVKGVAPTTSVTNTYTVSSTVDGCTGTASYSITTNALPVITTQPAPATQTLCPGFNVTYSVAATGTGLTFQWRRNGTPLTDNFQITGATTNTLTITNIGTANAGTYDVVVSGTCTPAVTSTAAVLTVATAPVISTQPANAAVCAGQAASFTVATTGSVPAPTIFQWQVSTNAGVTWTNLTTGGSFTPTFNTGPTTTTMNNNRYRVIVTNSCGQSVTSNGAATLTVNALPTVTATALANRICLSDTLIALSGTPVGGSWSGIGVSGFNFIPTATAVGTYTLTYSFTAANACTATATITAKVEDCPERLRELDDDALIVYPNPNNGRFNVKINSTLYNYLGMKVYDSRGQLVNGRLENGVLTSNVFGGIVYGRVIPIDLTYLPAGVYIVKFYYENAGPRTSEKAVKVIIATH